MGFRCGQLRVIRVNLPVAIEVSDLNSAVDNFGFGLLGECLRSIRHLFHFVPHHIPSFVTTSAVATS